MKNILLIIFFLFSFNHLSKAQERLLDILPMKDGKVTYTGIVNVENVTKEELYKRAKRWMIDTYKINDNLIQIEEETMNELVGSGYFEERWKATFFSYQNVNVHQVMKLQIKEGRYKYEISDFRMKYTVLRTQNNSDNQFTTEDLVDSALENWNKFRTSNNQKFYPKIDSQVKYLISTLDKTMRNPIEENW